ncbi:GNAT family N-acetyltransferase [Chengkuizengella axinellae]|uniref:GNAT family N-acetyltransferase n=1 Tax=Chengkuizengella axinellae TaxID=3064388 RepID=A0ABT9IY12_9BACL|nr:GNAT family N-acetyltransferase [Chengkuizengella sp. 2205SS18-9]MDP5274252.1 GNAT family N-acetyltransferase [Chengkuizengella sp. 2205SS18-9]
MNHYFIEELSLNQWPALQTMYYDGWTLRFTNGYTKRANCIHTLQHSTYDLNLKIKQCEHIYSTKKLNTIFKITPFSKPHLLDERLEEQGYSLIDPTSIQTLDLNTIKEPTIDHVEIMEELSNIWIDPFCKMNKVVEKHKTTMKQMLSNIVTKKCFISLYDENQIVACGLGVIERDYIGLYDIITEPKFRNQGFGEQLILNLLHWGKEHGAKYSYLAVVLSNKPALKLYSKIGYKEVYQYWYRVK